MGGNVTLTAGSGVSLEGGSGGSVAFTGKLPSTISQHSLSNTLHHFLYSHAFPHTYIHLIPLSVFHLFHSSTAGDGHGVQQYGGASGVGGNVSMRAGNSIEGSAGSILIQV